MFVHLLDYWECSVQSLKSVKSSDLKAMRYEDGPITRYNSDYWRTYLDLKKLGKVVDQELNTDVYLETLGRHKFVEKTRDELETKQKSKSFNKKGDLKRVMDISIF